ncbi:T9SS type B sorting domain-containing protein [Flavobacterium sp. P4023]|uniref:T9SS type B sorting domain-containing protein n=1 Tax=Flavobacterium flabelliforme TaxID=2816119 RepID=A0ABS5CR85_9FLAO|nr:T9SS type B sorting domain-containing protein [Flavobacterium flabelliforme]
MFTIIFLQSFLSYSQNYVPFTPRYNKDIKGDMLLIGNSILNRNDGKNNKPNDAYNGTDVNSSFDMQFINIDNGVSGIFNSSSAKLVVPNSDPNPSNPRCYKIVYAGLYWGAVTKGTTDIKNIKFKMPTGGYNDIVGTVIHNSGNTAVGTSFPYACYADVTSLVTGSGNPNPQGNYTIANVSSAVGSNGGTGLSAGWSLFVVYEDPQLPAKSITSFDGFSAISSTVNLDIQVSGFRTIPNGPVRAKFAFSALEGDLNIPGDYLMINNSVVSATNGVGTVIRTPNNFFNSTVTYIDPTNSKTENFLNRNPASENTLGYDAGILDIINNSNKVIKNGDTKATIGLRSSQDVYFYYFNAIALDIIEPKIILTKSVLDKYNSTTEIGGNNVHKGDPLWYKIGFENQGNDNAKNLVIKDVLPDNIIFDESSLVLPAGVSHVYTPGNKTLTFTVNNSLVKKTNDAGTAPYFHYDIWFKVNVIEDCYALSKICNSEIKNQAFAKYNGDENKVQVDTESYAKYSVCELGSPAPTNFLVGIEDCKYVQEYQFCGVSVDLKAADGYDTYVWSKTKNGPTIATGQIYKALAPGTYYVKNTSSNACYKPIIEEIIVNDATSTYVNPVIPYADNDVTERCVNNNKFLPKIFLCGKKDFKDIKTGITGAVVVWEKTTCVDPLLADTCANESLSCVWSSAGANGPNFKAENAGQYRVTITYAGGCVARHYFNIYKNDLDPKIKKQDIICTTKGQIIVENVGPAGYSFSKDGVNFQTSNIFDNVAEGDYTITIRQIVNGTPCDFTVKTTILKKIFSTTVNVIGENCPGTNGKIEVQAKDVRAQYQYFVYKAGTTDLVSSSALINDDRYTFNNLSPGKYDVKTVTDDGCENTKTVEIFKSNFKASAAISKPLTACSNGEITITTQGGTPNYTYNIVGPNGSFDQSSKFFQVTVPGDYTITAIDKAGCEYKIDKITVSRNNTPVYTVVPSNVKCYGDKGSIAFNVTNDNGYTITYSINNGANYFSNPNFSGLPIGTYSPKIKYSITATDGTVYECFDTKPDVTLGQPSAELTASAGVSELAGCGPGGEGKVRITNPQGGTPIAGANPYLYSFDGSTYDIIKEKYLAPGSYTVYIKDANECVYPMKVIIDPQPIPPSIDIDSPLFNCTGTATSTVTVTNNGGSNFAYEYLLDGAVNPNTANPKVFLNVPSGEHTVSVKYKLLSVSTYSNLLREDFGYGDDTTSPGINTTYYCFERQVEATKCNGNIAINDGDYSVTAKVVSPFGSWINPVDHTPAKVPAITKGRYLAVNIGDKIPVTAILYQKSIKDIIPNQGINVELYAINLLRTGTSGFDPDIRIELVDAGGNVVDGIATGNIPKSVGNNDWQKYGLVLNPGNNTNLNFVIRSNVKQTDGNDVAIDDIAVYQLPKSCITLKEFKFSVATDKAFKASVTNTTNVTCAGKSDGTITINAENFNTTYGYQYSIDGVNWITQTAATYKITGLTNKTYNVQIRYDATSTGTCLVAIPKTITSPLALEVNASATDAKCTPAGATVTATAVGGTPAYTYQLIDTKTPFAVVNFPSNGILTGVLPGTYKVRGTDANSCTDDRDTDLVIAAPVAPTAVIDVSSNLCFSGSGATLVIKASGGTAPYTFKLDTSSAVTSNNSTDTSIHTFSNVVVGNHTIIVTDSKGCTATPITQIINAQVNAEAKVTKTLTCNNPKDATIQVTVKDGTAPYTYRVKKDAGVYSGVVNINTNPFNYTATASGKYVFEITDANKCTTTTDATVSAISNPTATFKLTDPSCNNDATGEIQIIPAGGSAGYTFSFNGGGFTAPDTTKGLNAFVGSVNKRDYTYQVKDNNGCVSPVYTITLNNPSKVVASATFAPNTTCNTQTVITLSGIGGSGVYSYNFDGSTNYSDVLTKTFTNTATAQTITYSVKDDKGCFDTKTIVIPAYNPPTGITISNPTTITCTATTTSLTLTSNAGIAPFTYTITAPASATSNVSGVSSGIFTGLTSGVYSFQVKDANGCVATGGKTIDAAATIAVSGSKSDEKCFGAKDGTATFNITGASTPGNYTYVLTPAAPAVLPTQITKNLNEIKVTGLAAGTYTLTVKDVTTGCTSNTATVTVLAATQINFTAVGTKINCKTTKSTLTISGLLGGAPGYSYAYAISPSTAPTTAYNANLIVDTADLTTLIDVYVKDSNDCFVKKTITIASEDAPKINPLTPPCYVGTPIPVNITGTTVGTPTYSKDGINFQASSNFSLTPGSYTLAIKDGFGCVATTPYVIAEQLTLIATPKVDVTCTPNTTIDLTPKGGKGAYTFAVSFNGSTTYTSTTSPYVTAIAGTYKFKVTDSATPACEAFSTDVVVNTKPTVITYSFNHENVKCKGDATGSITITNPSGKAPFTYSIKRTTAPTATFTTSSITGLIAGNYEIVVTDALGCTSTPASVTITEPTDVLSASAAAPPTTTCSTTTRVTVTAVGGTAPFQYSFKGQAYIADNFYDVVDNGISDQIISYQVKDVNGCITVSKDITVKKLTPPTGINFSTPAAITCNPGFTTTSLTLTSVGGLAPYTYTVISGPTLVGTTSSGTFSGLIAGAYTFEVKDANGCTKQVSQSIADGIKIKVSGVKTDEKCFNAKDGTATFTITEPSSSTNFTYVLSPNLGTIVQTGNEVKVTGLGTGSYTLTVTDKTTGCSQTSNAVVVAAATQILIDTVTATNVNCNKSESTIVVNATGGIKNYKYAYVVKGASQPSAGAFATTNTTINTGVNQTNLDWDVYVMDQNGCIAGPFYRVITRDASPSTKTPAPAALCFVAGSTPSLDVSTLFNLGTGTHKYTVNGTAITGTNYNIKASGTYTIIATDANNCSATATYIVKPELTILATRVKDLDCISDARISFVASEGSKTYTSYEVQLNGAGAWTPVNSPFDVAVAGNYQIRVTDNAGCTAVSNIIEITQKTTPTFLSNKTNISCFGGSNGVITITNPTGLAPFTYSIKKGVSVVAFSTIANGITATGLTAGTYDVVMKDSKNCTFSESITLSEPTQLVTTATVTTPLSCGALNATQDAIITVDVPTTGTAPYKYSFNGGAFDTSNTYAIGVAGNVTVQVQDSNMCTLAAVITVPVAALNIPKLALITGTTLYCAPLPSTTSTVQVSTIAGTGVAPLSYTLVSGPSAGTTTATPGEFKNLIAGTYVFKVTDDNGCTDTQSYTVKSLVTINAVVASQIDVKCYGDATGSVKITVSGFTGTYTASLVSGTGTITPVGATTNTTIDVTGLVQGAYTLRVLDNVTGCSKDVTFTIAEPTAVTLTLTSNKNANCNTPLATVTVTAAGGRSPYSYAFISTTGNPAAGDYILNKNTANLNPATATWYVWVKDANGCEKQLATPVTIVKDPAAKINLPAQQCFNGSPFTITLTGTGTGTLKYSVNGIPITGNTYSITAAGTYKLGVVDANNCDDFVNYTVDKQILATSFLDKDITCVAPIDASITVNITNGTGPYSYQIYDGVTTVGSVVTGIATTTFTNTFATPGNYSFLVTDSKGCTVQTNKQLVTPTVIPVITSVVQPINKMILCHDEETAEIVVTYDNTIGTAPFIINVKNNTTGKDYGEQTTGLKAGVYTITLTDARGCATTSTITITDPPAIVIDAVAAPITCDAFGVSKGSVTINGVTGGKAPYDYFVTGKFYTNSALGETGGTVVFNVVDPGIYQVIVKDANGCTAIVADLKVASDVKDLDISVVLPPANCTTGGSATVAVGALSTNITGNGPFFFQIYTGQPQIYPAGTWLAESSTGSKKATFTNLTPGVSYSFVIFDSLTGCYFTSPAATAIPSNSTLVAAVSAVSNVACKGDSNGKVAFSVTSLYAVSTPITYEIFEATTKTSTSITGVGTVPANGNISFVNIGPLPIGAYYILIKEDVGGTNAGCSVATANFNITESLELLTVTASNTKKVNCNANSGVITASAQKGTGPYKYQYLLATATPPTASSLLWIDSTTYKTSVTGNYIVYAKDAYGCIQSTPVTVDPEIAPAIGTITPASLCYTGTAIAVTVTADATTILPVTYSVNQGAIIGGYSNNNVFNLTPGTYTLNIKDGYGCIASAPFTVKEQLTLNPIAIKKVDCKTAVPNGGITVKADGGNTVLPATYTYSITAGPTINSTGAATGIFTDLADGNYTFEVSDGTCTATTTATIDALVPIVPTAAAGIPLCVGQATTVIINATGGTGTYTYQKGAAPTLPTETNNEFNQTVAEGEVTYYIKDANDCVETIKVTVTDPTPIAIPTIVVDQMRCGGGNDPIDATITVTTSGGTNNFVYSFDNGFSYSSNNIRKTTTAGTYNIIVKDSNGCTTVMIPIVIDALDPPKITGFVPTQMTCPALTSDVKINYSKGIGTVTYTLVSGPSFPNNSGDTSGTYIGLLAGDYMFRVTDSKGCTDEKLYTVQKLPALQLVPNVVYNVKCKGGATGKATFTASSTTAPGAFTFSVATTPFGLPVISSRLGDVITLEDLAIGTYDVTIKDITTNCEITKSVTITEPALDLSIGAVPSNVSCDKPISQITMSPAGGTPNYKYAIVPPGFSGAIIFSDVTTIDTSTLTNGVATPLGMTWAVEVYVQDANLCTAMIPITITKDDTPTVSVPTLASNQCTAAGNYTFVATGTGVLPLSFSINGTDFFTSTGTTYTFTVPAPTAATQAYTVTVKDGNGCIATSATAVTVYKPLQLAVTQVKDLTCAPAATTAATFTFSATDGNNASYTFAVSIDSAPFATITSPYANSTVGTYVFQVTDANNCTVQSDPFKVTAPIDPAIASTVISSPIECFGGTATLTVNVDLSKGVAPYTFVLSGATNNTGDSSGIYTGLVAGTYSVVVTDAKGCSSAVATQVINNPPLLIASATQSINTTCSTATVITVVGSGGTPTATGTGYSYSFDNGFSYDTLNTKTVNDNGAIQTILYSVKDANGCTTVPQPIVVNPLNKPTDLDFIVTVAPTCPIPSSTISVKATNGVGSLTFEIIEFNGVAPATSFVVPTTGFADPAVFAGLLPGDYLFRVTDANGCAYQELYPVKAVTKIAIVGALKAAISCNAANGINNNGSATFTVTGFSATGNYSVVTSPPLAPSQISNVGDVITLTGLSVGTYTVTVTDNTTGCQKDDSVTLVEPVAITFTTAATKVFCSRQKSTITVSNVVGGTGVYTYAVVKTGALAPIATVYTDNPVLEVSTNLTDLSWDVYVKDANGCVSAPVTTPIIYNAAPTIDPAAPLCFVGSTLTVDLDALSNTYNGVKSYTVDGLAIADKMATFNAPGTYLLGVKDDNGCEETVPYTIEKQLLATASLTKDLFCTGVVAAEITVDIKEGVAPYTYQMYLNGTAVGTVTGGVVSTFTENVTTPGIYTFEITDSNAASCTVTTDTVEVTNPSTPTFTTSQVNVKCNGESNGSITVIPANGVAPYTFVLSGAINNTGDSSGIYTGLAAGSYTIVVTDAKGCSSVATGAIVITEPGILTATDSYPANNTCSVATLITVAASNGTQTGVLTGYYYNFNSNGYDSDNTFTVNDNGAIQTVTYTVKDANGCETAPKTITINPLNKPTDLDFTVTVAPICPTPTSTISVKATNGVGALTFEIIEFNGVAPATPIVVTTPGFADPAVFAGLLPGEYTFKVTDANGCSYQELITVDAVVNIVVTGQPVADMSCNTGDDGKVEFNISRFSGNYNYSITKDGVAFGTLVANSTLSTIPLTGLGHGTYEITVLDNTTLCQAVATAVVKQPSIVTVALVNMDNANCKTAAQATVVGNGGTPGYTYSFVPTTAGPGTFGPSDSEALDPAISTTWYVYAKDSNNCISAPLTINVVTDPLPAGFTAAVVSQCPSATGTYDIVVTIGTGMAPYEYSIGSGFQTSTTFTVNVAKAYDLIVKDRFGCEFTFPAAVTILPALGLDATITALPSCTDGDGVVDLVALGGSTNYEYRKGTGVYVPTSQFTGVSSGLNTFEVRDKSTNCTFSVTVDLVVATPITGFALASTDVSCNGGNDGTITATMTNAAVGINDNPIYTYQIIAPTIGAIQTDNVFNGLTKGTYTVEITSGRGCKETAIISVDEPALITVPAPVVTPFACAAGTNGTNFATITVNGVAGGSSNYTIYEFFKNNVSVQRGPSNSYIEVDYAGGSYTVDVYDDKNCVGSTTVAISIPAYTKLEQINVVVTTAITCNNPESITVTAVDALGNAIAGIDYVLKTDANVILQTNTTGIFTGLPIGNYIITATNPLTGCTIRTDHYVNTPNTFELKLDSVVDAICFGDANGSAQVTFIDRVINATDLDQAGIFDYIVKDAAGNTVVSLTRSTGVTVTIPSLKAGTYSIDATLVNTPFCTASTNFTISQPNAKLTIAETHTEITCIAGNNDGTISVTATGGWPGDYEFELIATNPALNVSYSAVSDFLNLTAGTYTINVKDSKGCVDTIIVQLANPTPITFTAAASATLLSCFGDTTATITVSTPTGGSGSYLYTLITTLTDGTITSNGPQLDNIFTNLGVGSYQVQVSDTWNCSSVSTTPIVISEPTKVVASLVKATGITCKTDATLTLSVVGGKAPYTYSADPNFATSINMTGSSITFPVIVGTYNYYVKDANGCISFASNDIKIDNLEPLLPNLDVLNAMVSCKGSATGVIVANASGGLGNYVYTLLDGAGNAIPTAVQTTPGRFDNLLAGFYQVIVVSGDCSSTSQIVEIKEPSTSLSYTPKVSNITCNGAKNGRIEIIASGGTGEIKYAISPRMDQFFDTGVFENLVPDVYQVVIQDANGCFEVYDFEIKEPLELLSDIVPGSINEEFCAGDKDGAFSIDIEGGTLPYSVSLDDRNGTYTTGSLTQTFFDFNGLAGGDHTVYIRDANGCTTVVTAPLKESVTMNPKAVVQYDCVNNAAANTVTITIDDSITDPSEVDYAIDGGTFQSSSIFTNVAPGFHTVIARNLNGCEQPTVNFEVIQVNPLTLVLNDGGLNEIVAVATGGGGNYTYTFNGENYGSTSSFIIYKSGDYTVTVTDANGCTATATRYFTYIDVCIPNNFTPNGDNINDTWAPGCTVNYKDLVFSIFDRYGRKIGTYRVGQEWDGKYNGEELPSGDYWYILKLNDKKDDREFVGHFTLYR